MHVEETTLVTCSKKKSAFSCRKHWHMVSVALAAVGWSLGVSWIWAGTLVSFGVGLALWRSFSVIA